MSVLTETCANSEELNVLGWDLVCASGDEQDRRIPIIGARVVVGRRAGNEIVLSHPTVSGRHAELIRTPDGFVIRDLNSTNGTRVNERRIDEAIPLQAGDRIRFGSAEVRIEQRTQEADRGTIEVSSFGVTSRFLGFDQLLNEPAVIPFYQPIVRLENGDIVGYEVLARSEVPGFETPGPMFQTAEQMEMEHEFSDVCRIVGVKNRAALGNRYVLYLNTHPSEIGDPRLIESIIRLRRMAPDQKIALEIHESHVTNLAVMGELKAQLRHLDIEMAYDDFGAGQTRLLDLSEVPPDVLKFDIKLIKGLSSAGEKRRRMVSTLVDMVTEFDVIPLAEGIETREDLEACRDIGFQLAQGFFIGRPQRADAYGESLGETMVASPTVISRRSK